MNQENTTIQPEFAKPGLNPFLVAMAQSKQSVLPSTPVQQVAVELRKLEKSAETGDLKAWQDQLPRVEAALASLQADPMRRLEIQVEIKQHEWTLLFKASKGALQQAQLVEQQAKEAELTNRDTAKELWRKAQKFKQLGQHFQECLNAKLLAA